MSDDVHIDKKLNLVIAVDTEKSGRVYVHSTPLRREIFKQYFRVISKAFAQLYNDRLNVIAGPAVARFTLEEVAVSLDQWDGPGGVQNGLLSEVGRISNVIVPVAGQGWSMMPLIDAQKRGIFSEDDWDEIEGAIIFFISASAIHRRRELQIVLSGMESLWGALLTSLNVTEYRDSLRTSTPAENSTPPVEMKQ